MASPLRAVLIGTSALVLGSAAAAQTGPFAVGEVLKHNYNQVAGKEELLRIDPVTGDGEVVLQPVYWGGLYDGLDFDPYRDAIIACMSMAPDPYTRYKPYAVFDDGSYIGLPGMDGNWLAAIAPGADGNLYVQGHGSDPELIQFYDAGNQLHTLMDDTGLAPFLLKVEHMRYHASSNALIAARTTWSGGGCNANENTLYRIPLSADGSQVAGPVTCTSFNQATGYIIDLGDYPGDMMLMVLAGWPYDKKLQILDPLTLNWTLYGEVETVDINGGIWSDTLGQVAVFDDVSNELRAVPFGSAGAYTVINVDIPIGNGQTGSGPHTEMAGIYDLAPSCAGFTQTYGSGLEGLGGYTPMLDATGCPDLGRTFSIVVQQVRGGQTGMVFAGLSAAAVPFKGGTFLVADLGLTLAVTLPGSSHVAGVGALALPVVLDDPAFVGLDLFCQGAFTDAGAVKGVSLTNGLQVRGY